MKDEHIKISKFLSLILRHKPETIGLELDEKGWASIDEIIYLAAESGKTLDRKTIEAVVETNDKKRFSISSDGFKIRANQGHSVHVDLDLSPIKPPSTLYHGTATRFLESILCKGLHSSSRHHVHLSSDCETAIKVGQRHGKPVILKIDSGSMDSDGHVFFRSENGVWLTDNVPPQYIHVYREKGTQ